MDPMLIRNPLIIESFEDLDLLKDAWEELYRASGSESHYLTFDFIRLWYECFAAPEHVRIFQIVEHDLTVGFLPLVMVFSKGIRILSSITNYHCMHCGPLVRAGYEAVFQKRLLSELNRAKGWDVLKIEYSYDFDTFPGVFTSASLNESQYRWRRTSEPTYTVPLDQDFAVFLSEVLSNKSRKVYQHMRNRYNRSVAWSVQFFSGAEALARWGTFLDLEDSGWKGEGGSSIKKIAENYQRFYCGLLDQLAKSDALRISLLELEGKAIAGGFMYQEGDIIHLFKTGYDAQFHEKSPSNILFVESVRHLSELPEGLKLLNVFPGDFGYKHKYMQQQHCCSTTVLYRTTVRGRCLYCYHQLKTLVKAFLDRQRYGISYHEA